MFVVGITGGLATGKSLVTRLLRERGAVVFSADEAARAILNPGGATLQAIARTLGAELLTAEGHLDRARLAQRVFADPAARTQLNRITHPPILRLLRAQIDAARDDLPPQTVVVVEVPLLYETQMEDWFDLVVVVRASEPVQIARLCLRNGLTAEEARRRIGAQWPLAEKAARADVVIDNEGEADATIDAVDRLWRRLKRRMREEKTRLRALPEATGNR